MSTLSEEQKTKILDFLLKYNKTLYDDLVQKIGLFSNEELVNYFSNIYENTTLSEVKVVIIYCLEEIGSQLAIPILLKGLEDLSEDVRYAATNKLGVIKSNEAVEPLIKHLLEPTRISYEARQVLKKYGKEIIPTLIEHLKDEQMMLVIVDILVSSRFRKNDDEVINQLIAELDDPNPNVRAAITLAIGDLTDSKQAEKLMTLGVEDKLLKLLDDNNPKVRRFAIRALGNLQSQKAVESIMRFLEDAVLKEEADKALKKLGKPYTDYQ